MKQQLTSRTVGEVHIYSELRVYTSVTSETSSEGTSGTSTTFLFTYYFFLFTYLFLLYIVVDSSVLPIITYLVIVNYYIR